MAAKQLEEKIPKPPKNTNKNKRIILKKFWITFLNKTRQVSLKEI